MNLTMHDHRIDRASHVIDRRVARDLDHAGFRIDLDFADMATIGKRREVHGFVAYAVQAAQIVRQIVALHRRGGDFEDADRAVRPLNDEAAGGKLQIGRGGFQDMTGDPHSFGDDLVRGAQHDDAADPQRASGMRPAAHRDARRIALHQHDAVDRNAEPFTDELGETCFVALAAGDRADDEFHDTLRLHCDLGSLARDAGRRIDIIGDADATAFSAPFRFRAACHEACPVA